MNNKPTKQEDQTPSLWSLLDEVQQGDKENKSQLAATEKTDTREREVDVLNLPPRKEVHRKKQRTHLKMGSPGAPLLRFLIVFILLLGVLAGAYLIWGEELITVISNL
ncbi:hypothetical protein [Virgibacillus sp. CBA3643]|uniref:hypothetical protein n=1 Tax=Virgibacillus sp. CBA3643 TaxID=2942278 RepID=UPI0035A27BF3